MIWEVLVIILLILLNAFFAMSEMALVSSRRVRLQQMAEEKRSKGARAALELSENPGNFLSTVQVGITLIGIIAGAYGGATLADVEKAVDAEIEKVISSGVTQDELDRARNRFLRSLIFARDSQSGMARIYGSTLTTGGTIRDIDEWPERVKKVTTQDVQNVARKYLSPDRAVTGYLLPAGGNAG